jgi:hypothetical protein
MFPVWYVYVMPCTQLLYKIIEIIVNYIQYFILGTCYHFFVIISLNQIYFSVTAIISIRWRLSSVYSKSIYGINLIKLHWTCNAGKTIVAALVFSSLLRFYCNIVKTLLISLSFIAMNQS